MSELYEKTGEWMPCACMGAMYGEQYCRCVMASMGLHMSEARIKANTEAKEGAEAFSWPEWGFLC